MRGNSSCHGRSLFLYHGRRQCHESGLTLYHEETSFVSWEETYRVSLGKLILCYGRSLYQSIWLNLIIAQRLQYQACGQCLLGFIFSFRRDDHFHSQGIGGELMIYQQITQLHLNLYYIHVPGTGIFAAHLQLYGEILSE